MQTGVRSPISALNQLGHRTTTHGWIIVVIAMILQSLPASASGDFDERDAAIAMAVPASVSTVVEAGLWGERGSYRIVVTEWGFEHVYNNVYAQWLSTDDEGESKIEKSIPVKQLSHLLPSVIGGVRFVFSSKQSQGVFEIDLVDRNTQKKSVAILKLGKPGEASVEMPPAEPVE